MDDKRPNRNVAAANRRVAFWLGAAVLGMFGFGYALVPLYDVFCQITGLNGKTGRIAAETAAAAKIDKDRVVTVEFLTTTNGLPWNFYPLVTQVQVHPGELTEVAFMAENKATAAISGQAVPSISPNESARY